MECLILELPKHFQKLSKQSFLAVHFKIGLNLKRKKAFKCVKQPNIKNEAIPLKLN